MYRKQVRRRRAVLVALVVISLILLSAHFSEAQSGPLHAIQKGVSAVLSPIGEAADRALKPARDAINWFDETFDARGENKALEAEVAELRQRLAEAEGAVEQNKQFREMLGVGPEILDGYEVATARVLFRSPWSLSAEVTLDKGSSSGIEIDDPVLVTGTLAGRITAVTSGTAEVTLITDGESAIQARVRDGGPIGILEPQVGDPEELSLNFIRDDRDVEEGDFLDTAGTASDKFEALFPPGIAIGEVTSAEPPGEEGGDQEIRVRPFANLREFDFAQVLIGGEDPPE